MLDQFAWLQPVLAAAAVVFVLDLIGNTISFSNRVLNALTTALVFAVLFGSLIHFGLVKLDMKAIPTPAAVESQPAPAAEPAPAPAADPAAPAPAPATP
jgi:hypothetical protein